MVGIKMAMDWKPSLTLHPSTLYLYFALYISEISPGLFLSDLIHTYALPKIWICSFLSRIIGLSLWSYGSVAFGPIIGLISSICLLLFGALGMILSSSQSHVLISQCLLGIGSANVNIIRYLLLHKLRSGGSKRSVVILETLIIQYGALCLGASFFGSIISSVAHVGYLLAGICLVLIVSVVHFDDPRFDSKERLRLLPAPSYSLESKQGSCYPLILSYFILKAAMGVLEVFFPTLLSWSEEEIGWNSFASNILTLVVLGAAWYLRSIHSSLSSASFFFISISGILALSSAIVHSQLLLTCSLFFMTSCGYPSATITLIEKSFDASPNTSVQAVMARLGLFEILGILSRWATPWCLQYFQCSPSYQLVAYASLVFLYCISRLHDASSF